MKAWQNAHRKEIEDSVFTQKYTLYNLKFSCHEIAFMESNSEAV